MRCLDSNVAIVPFAYGTHQGNNRAVALQNTAPGGPHPAFQLLLKGRGWSFHEIVGHFFENVDHPLTGQWAIERCQMVLHDGIAFIAIGSTKVSFKDTGKGLLHLFKVEAPMTK